MSSEEMIVIRKSEMKAFLDDVSRQLDSIKQRLGMPQENESAGAETPAVAETPRARRSDRN